MKKHYFSAMTASLFLLLITYLTVQYLTLNKDSLAPAYKFYLSITAILNILCFAGVIIINTTSLRRMLPAYIKAGAQILIVGIVILGATIKARLHRQIPMTNIKDFMYWPTFNELWEPYQRFFWHFGLDFLVFCTVLLLSTSYKWLPQLLQHFNISKKA